MPPLSSRPSLRRSPPRRDRQQTRERRQLLTGTLVILLTIGLASLYSLPRSGGPWLDSSAWFSPEPAPLPLPTPLKMSGGDPYLRALMRTISASESHSASPYTLLYGGQHVTDLSRHPDQCIPIVTGPNLGQCTTAAGRYQFLTTTWFEKARLYHSQPPAWYTPWNHYDFEAEHQDEVVYTWLSDAQAWGYDLSALLRQGDVLFVLELLSDTWTSLGYGIETNSMTPYLEEIYHQVLAEELSGAG